MVNTAAKLQEETTIPFRNLQNVFFGEELCAFNFLHGTTYFI